MTKAKSWEVTDEFWERVERLIPIRQRLSDQSYARKAGGGRNPKMPGLSLRPSFMCCVRVASGRHS